MTWQTKAMKDVVSSDMLRESQTGFDPEISEWGNPPWVIPGVYLTEFIGEVCETKRIETSK